MLPETATPTHTDPTEKTSLVITDQTETVRYDVTLWSDDVLTIEDRETEGDIEIPAALVEKVMAALLRITGKG